jgi:hypothetical protein
MDGRDGRQALCYVAFFNYDGFPVLSPQEQFMLASFCFAPGYKFLSAFASGLEVVIYTCYCTS